MRGDPRFERAQRSEEHRAAAQQALALDPALPEAHGSLALVAAFHDWDLPGAERAFKEALRLNPNYAEAHACLAELEAHGRAGKSVAAWKPVAERL